LPGNARQNASELHDCIHQKPQNLPDTRDVYSAHFAGSLCGIANSGTPSSTIAFEKRWNPQLSSKCEAFVEALVDVPPKPAEMQHVMRVYPGRAERR
jgi:hypothetical protein